VRFPSRQWSDRDWPAPILRSSSRNQ
jgi:hypothetical protein